MDSLALKPSKRSHHALACDLIIGLLVKSTFSDVAVVLSKLCIQTQQLMK